jgi:hypothetical protein
MLAAADEELVLLHSHLELLAGEAGDGEGDAQAFRPLGRCGDPLDIVGRIALGPLRDPVQHPFELVETQEEGR